MLNYPITTQDYSDDPYPRGSKINELCKIDNYFMDNHPLEVRNRYCNLHCSLICTNNPHNKTAKLSAINNR